MRALDVARLVVAFGLATPLAVSTAYAAEPPHDIKGLYMMTDYPAVTVRPGTTSNISLRLQNYDLGPQRYRLSVEGVPSGWTATLLGGVDRRLDRRFNVIVLPVVAAFVTAQWDLVIDPPSATIAKAWIWHEGGALFGVPPSNFFGWLLTSWLFFQGFALYLHFRDDRARPDQVADRRLRLVGILFYVCGGITHVVPWMLGQSGDIADAAGQSWRLQDIRGATVVIMVFTMLFTSLLALIRLLDRARPDERPRVSN